MKSSTDLSFEFESTSDQSLLNIDRLLRKL